MATTDRPDRGEGSRTSRRLLDSARPLLWGALAVVVVALVAGFLFSRTDPQRAATILLGDQVLTEPEGEVTSGPAPTSGQFDGGPTCGAVAEPVPADQQVDALAAGIVVVQYRSAEDAEAVTGALAGRPTEVLVAPNADIDAPVVATAWGRRLRLEQVDAQVLQAFVTAHAGIGPRVTDCQP